MQAHPSSGESNGRALVVVADDFKLTQGPGYASLNVSQRVRQRISADEQLWRRGDVVCDYAYVRALHADVLEEYSSCRGYIQDHTIAAGVRSALDAVLQKRAESGTPHPRCVRGNGNP